MVDIKVAIQYFKLFSSSIHEACMRCMFSSHAHVHSPLWSPGVCDTTRMACSPLCLASKEAHGVCTVPADETPDMSSAAIEYAERSPISAAV